MSAIPCESLNKESVVQILQNASCKTQVLASFWDDKLLYPPTNEDNDGQDRKDDEIDDIFTASYKGFIMNLRDLHQAAVGLLSAPSVRPPSGPIRPPSSRYLARMRPQSGPYQTSIRPLSDIYKASIRLLSNLHQAPVRLRQAP
ncbi:hypothetical protein PoB_006937600 [Plakobranchus ocellatus]|uniref:Uncharacterized protein n=1 Tax=Plakobranchus ocellatus TaxID=259542 RepID=A0AAV4DGA1_9GAST|nr:hypothetical protein PoB_006937600 [Plakobranchus ocellatus]